MRRLAARGLAHGLTMWSKTCDYRIEHYDASYDPGHAAFRHRSIFVFWHEYIGILLPQWRNRNVTLLISQHRDGEFVKDAAEALGYRTVRGSTTRGGTAALRQMSRIGQTSPIAITTDGPQGPRRHMAPGAIFLASLLRIPIVPVGVGIKDAWRLKTWDRMAIAKPLTRVRILFGPPIMIPRGLSREGLEEFRAAVQQVLEMIDQLAVQRATNPRYRFGDCEILSDRRSASSTLTGEMSNIFAPAPLRTTVGFRSPSIKCRPTG